MNNTRTGPISVTRGLDCYVASAGAGFVMALTLLTGVIVLSGPSDPRSLVITISGLVLFVLFPVPIALFTAASLARQGRRWAYISTMVVGWLGVIIGGLIALALLPRLVPGSGWSVQYTVFTVIAVCGGAAGAAFGIAGGVLLCLPASRHWFRSRPFGAGQATGGY